MASLVKELGFPITNADIVWVRKASKFLAALVIIVEEEGILARTELEAYVDERLSKIEKKTIRDLKK